MKALALVLLVGIIVAGIVGYRATRPQKQCFKGNSPFATIVCK